MDGHISHELLRQPNVRDVVRGAEVHVDLGVLVDDDELEAPGLRPEVLPERGVEVRRLLDSLVAVTSLNIPRMRSENSHTGSCGGVFFMNAKSGEMAAGSSARWR